MWQMYTRAPPLSPPSPPCSDGESEGVLRAAAAKWSASEPHYLITSTAKTAKTLMIRRRLSSMNVDIFLLNHVCLFLFFFLT